MALLRVWGMVTFMSWPELHVDDYESMLSLMQRLGIKGGYSVGESTPPHPNRIAADGRVLLRNGPVVEEFIHHGDADSTGRQADSRTACGLQALHQQLADVLHVRNPSSPRS